jgi:acyl carrier protein
MAKISGLVWAEFSHEQLVSWQFSMGKSDRLLVVQSRANYKTPKKNIMSDNKTPFEQEVAALIVEALNLEIAVDEIEAEQRLYQEGLGLDSIDMLEISLAVSKKYGFQLKSDDPDNAVTFSSLRNLAGHIEKNRAK